MSVYSAEEKTNGIFVRLDDLVLQKCAALRNKPTLIDDLSQRLVSHRLASAIRSVFTAMVVSLELTLCCPYKFGDVKVRLSSGRWSNKRERWEYGKLITKEEFLTYLFQIFSHFTRFRKLHISYEDDNLPISDILNNFLDENNFFPVIQHLSLFNKYGEANKMIIEKFSLKLKELSFRYYKPSWSHFPKSDKEIEDLFSIISKCIELRQFNVPIICRNEQFNACEMTNLQVCLNSLSQLEIFSGYMKRIKEFEAEWLSVAFQNCAQLREISFIYGSHDNLNRPRYLELPLLCNPAMRSTLSKLRKISFGWLNEFLIPREDTPDITVFINRLNYILKHVNKNCVLFSELILRTAVETGEIAPKPEAMENFTAWIKTINQTDKSVKMYLRMWIWGSNQMSIYIDLIERWLELCDKTTKLITIDFVSLVYDHDDLRTVFFDAVDTLFSSSHRFHSDCSVTYPPESRNRFMRYESHATIRFKRYGEENYKRVIRFKTHASLKFSIV